MVINSPQYKLFEQSPVILTELTEHKMTTICIGYSIIETKEADRIGYNGFLFPHEYSGEGRGDECGKRHPLYPIRVNSLFQL
jgi:hypothetical protein